MSWKKNNPYAPHTFHHFSWNVYNLLVYQFARYAVGAWVLLLIAVILSFWKIELLIKLNHDRIVDIEKSRIEACKVTYETIYNVFEPFFTPEHKRTPIQEKNINHFKSLTSPSKCIKVVKKVNK